MWELLNQSGLVLEMEQKPIRRKSRLYIFKICIIELRKAKQNALRLIKTCQRIKCNTYLVGIDFFEQNS